MMNKLLLISQTISSVFVLLVIASNIKFNYCQYIAVGMNFKTAFKR
ncbi:MAG: hypothetical protein JST75_12710 [Bacteroidetes bacterium]|nr:hypothetical protein [Bacteroidota bacterium]